MRIEAPYHDGERAVQERSGERSLADGNGRVIATEIPGAAVGFIRQQPMVVLSSIDAQLRPWASVLFGPPGFLQAESTAVLTADLGRAWPHGDDPFWSNIRRDDRFGMLVLELATRRRLRLNGRASLTGEALALSVERAYPNCPKYIQRRHLAGHLAGRDAPLPPPIRGTALTRGQVSLVTEADTLFVASMHPEQGADASHRGGRPGFVEVLDERTVRIPDYPGNSMFNTLGNFTSHPTGGILLPDFTGQRTLQLVGEVEIQWGLPDPNNRTGGTGRFWDLHIAESLELAFPVRAFWEFLDPSPFNP